MHSLNINVGVTLEQLTSEFDPCFEKYPFLNFNFLVIRLTFACGERILTVFINSFESLFGQRARRST